MTALVGPSGAGKTTISMLVSRLYDVDEGSVSINGLDLRDATTASLNATVGVVTQDSHLFHDTLRANLVFAKPDATDDEIATALASAQIADLVASLPLGLATVVGERGYRLSGGEKQRVALARLLLKSPRLVVLPIPQQPVEAANIVFGAHRAAVFRPEITLVGRHEIVFDPCLPQQIRGRGVLAQRQDDAGRVARRRAGVVPRA